MPSFNGSSALIDTRSQTAYQFRACYGENAIETAGGQRAGGKVAETPILRLVEQGKQRLIIPRL